MGWWIIVYGSVAVALTVAYVLLIYWYLKTWKNLGVWDIPNDFIPATKVTILIPARNEAENITACLESILHQDYPKELFEIIVLDDFSEDATPNLVRRFATANARLIQLKDYINESDTQAFKKKAIEIGVHESKGDLIVTTDADCVAPAKWLQYLVSFYQTHQWQLIAAPVNFYQEQNTLERFQSLDFMGMMCVTASGIHSGLQKMCNGANLVYTKSAFEAVNGFDKINHLASGDDILLMHKIDQRFPNQIAFLKNVNATIKTKAKPDWASFFSQRMRWATKNAGYSDWKVTAVLAMVFFLCWSIISSLVLGFCSKVFFVVFCIQLLGKTIADYYFLFQMANFFERKDLMASFLPSQMLHVVYIVMVGTWANFKKNYTWKGRKVR